MNSIHKIENINGEYTHEISKFSYRRDKILKYFLNTYVASPLVSLLRVKQSKFSLSLNFV